MKYIAQIEKETLEMSEKPTAKIVKRIGNVAYKSPPKKLSRSLNLTFKSMNSPITPNINNPPST